MTEGLKEERTERLVTVAQAAEAKGVTAAAVYLAVSQGRLAHVTVLGRIGLREADVQAWEPVSYRERKGAPPRGGRPKGKGVSAETRTRISAGQSRRWALRKGQAS